MIRTRTDDKVDYFAETINISLRRRSEQRATMNLDRLREGIDRDGDSDLDPRAIPDWMDMERFRRGQELFRRHVAAMSFALHCSLTVGFVIVRLLDPLVFTRRSDTPSKALLRYVETFVHVVLWHVDDVWDESTLGHRSVQYVRKMHGSVRRAMNARDIDSQRNLSQYDMGVVQAGFFAAVVMYPRQFGVRATARELDDYVFFWRGIGYLLGIEDEYNVCSGGYEESKALCREIEERIVVEKLFQPPPHFGVMADAYIDGANLPLKFSLSSKESVIAFGLDIKGYKVYPFGKLSWADRLRVWYLKLHGWALLWVPGFERLLNFLTMRVFHSALHLVVKQLNKESSIAY